jgi:hypothetical protein
MQLPQENASRILTLGPELDFPAQMLNPSIRYHESMGIVRPIETLAYALRFGA